MNKNQIGAFSFTLILLGATLTLASCKGNDDSFPQVASPPPFDYANGEDLRSGMHQLAFALLRLDADLSKENDEDPSYQQSVVDNLDKIEIIVEGIQNRDLNTKHPFLVENMDKFKADVSRAKWNAQRKTPNYYMAGRISGACVSCHQENS
ncbi:MAG: hypothetical protein KDF58_04255 [Alphaproteobacteria bacterium]|nr:hypothetical protein [Alphaproteobacteria bacterium]HPF47351.1 hypothetical protein [Emcibacteraceae bacterium]HRW28545.1 hypothetical protein [Emcibacteraceae bacterium]